MNPDHPRRGLTSVLFTCSSVLTDGLSTADCVDPGLDERAMMTEWRAVTTQTIPHRNSAPGILRREAVTLDACQVSRGMRTPPIASAPEPR